MKKLVLYDKKNKLSNKVIEKFLKGPCFKFLASSANSILVLTNRYAAGFV